MYKPQKYETIADINDVLNNLNEAMGMMKYIGKYSDYVQQSRFDQFTRSFNEIIQSLEKIQESLQTELDNETIQ